MLLHSFSQIPKRSIFEISNGVLHSPPPQGAAKSEVTKVLILLNLGVYVGSRCTQTLMRYNFAAPWDRGTFSTLFEESNMPLFGTWRKRANQYF